MQLGEGFCSTSESRELLHRRKLLVSSTWIHSSDLRRWARQQELGRFECAQDRLVWFAESREALGKERADLLGLAPFVFDEVSQRHDESSCRSCKSNGQKPLWFEAKGNWVVGPNPSCKFPQMTCWIRSHKQSPVTVTSDSYIPGDSVARSTRRSPRKISRPGHSERNGEEAVDE